MNIRRHSSLEYSLFVFLVVFLRVSNLELSYYIMLISCVVPYIYAASITSSQTVAVIGGVVAVVFIITAALIIVIAIVVLRYRRERYTIIYFNDHKSYFCSNCFDTNQH